MRIVLGFAIWAGLAVAAVAGPYSYLLEGDQLVRLNGPAIDVRDLRPGAPAGWRQAFALDAKALAATQSAELVCDPDAPAGCYIGLAAAGSDRTQWKALSLSGAAGPAWPAYDDLPMHIEDVDAASGEVLAIMRPAAASRAADPSPGFYLFRPGKGLTRLQALAADAGGAHWARFIRGGSGPPDLLLLRGGADAAWNVVKGDLSGDQPAPWVGEPQVLQGRDLYVAAQPAPGAGLGLVRASAPRQFPSDWPTAPVYVPAPAQDRGPLAPLADRRFPGNLAALRDGRVLAVVMGQAGQALISLCGDAAPARPFAAELADAPRLTVYGGQGAHAIVARTDARGDAHPYLLTAPPGADCHAPLTIEALPAASDTPPAPPPLKVERRTVASDDGESIPYALLGLPGGAVMIRAQGAGGLPVAAMAQTPLERAWLERGGRLVTATLRGDARFPAWKHDITGDYQQRAARDLLAVADDLVARKDARPGEAVLLGEGQGAFTAAKAAFARPNQFKAAILVSGVLDLQLRTDAGAQSIGPAAGGFAAWFAGQPADRCKAVGFLLYAGGADTVVDSRNATDFVDYLKTLHYPGNLSVFPNVDHSLAQAPFQATVFTDLDALAADRTSCRGR